MHGRAEGQPREDRHLRRGVAAGDVVAGVGLGVAQALGLGERLRRRCARAAISERMKLVVPLTIPWMRSIGVDGERFLEHAARPARRPRRPPRSAAARLLAREREQLLAVLGEQLLVRAHHVAPGAHRRQQVLARGLDAAHQLDDQVGLREDLREVAARAREHAGDHGRAAVEALDLRGALVQQLRERRADGAVAEQADANGARGGRARQPLRRHRARSDPRRSRGARPRARRRPEQKITGGRGTPL